MKITLTLSFVLMAASALCGEPSKPQTTAPEAVGAEANAKQRRDKHAAHRQKMSTLQEEFRAAKTREERVAVQDRMRVLRHERTELMRRSGRSGEDESTSEGDGNGRGGGKGRGDGKGGGRGKNKGGSQISSEASPVPKPKAKPEAGATKEEKPAGAPKTDKPKKL